VVVVVIMMMGVSTADRHGVDADVTARGGENRHRRCSTFAVAAAPRARWRRRASARGVDAGAHCW
jgi:hypothetical protein